MNTIPWNEAVEKATLSRVKGDDKVSIIDGNKVKRCYLDHFYGEHWLEIHTEKGVFRIAGYEIQEMMLSWIKEHKFLAVRTIKHKWLTLIEERKEVKTVGKYTEYISDLRKELYE